MTKKKRTLKVGPGGEVRLPPDALEAIEFQPGDEVELIIDTRRKQIHLERHVADPWAEAMRKKPEKGLEDLMDEQKQREEDAKELWERRVKEPPPKRRPEDDPDHWR